MTLDLFSPEPQANLLPFDGQVQDLGLILTAEQSTKYLDYFLAHLAWQPDEVVLYGKRYVTERKVVWYGDAEYEYHYSGSAKQARLWNPALFRLKQHIEQLVGHPFNSCLANLYENGSQAVGWHSDDEAELGQDPQIASLSLGQQRFFDLKHKTCGTQLKLELGHGSLLLMAGQCQQYWQHRVPKMAPATEGRINLTFREIKQKTT